MSKSSQLNLIGRISHFFTTNQSLSILLVLSILLFGLVAFFVTPKQYNPEITRPAFLVTLNYSGATIEQSLNRVVYELVEKINTIPGVDDIYTSVSDGGQIQTTVIFEVGYNITDAKLDLWSQLEQHSYLAQGFIAPPSIIEINPETIPVLQIVFASDNSTPSELRSDVIKLSHILGAVPDVSALSVHGGYQQNIIVELNPERLQATNVTISDVANTLSDVQGRSVNTGISSELYQIEVVLDDPITSAAELGALSITDDVRIRDIAYVYEGVAGTRSSVWYSDGKQRGETVVLGVSKVEGSSAPVVAKDFLTALDSELKTEQFKHLSYKIVSNDGETASTEIYGLSKNLITSIAIVSLVLMLFLSTRAALVVLIAIPTTLLIVFGLGWLFGETINRITLFALILSLGLLVDSAIVVVDNIYVHLKEWVSNPTTIGKERIIANAVSEVGVGLLLSTLTSVIVFLPMAYITGMMGPYMGPIAFFVPAALIVSLFVAVVITPFIASRIIKENEWQLPISRWFSARLNDINKFYNKSLKSILSSRKKQRFLLKSTLVLFIVSLILPMTALVHFQMLPRADRNQVYLYLDLPVDSSVTYTEQATKIIEGLLLKNTEVTNIQSYIAEPPIVDFNGMFKGAQGRSANYQATLRVNLTPTTKRSLSSSEVSEQLRSSISKELPNLSSYVRIMEEPPGPPVRATFVAKVSASDKSIQEAVANDLYNAISNVSGITDRYLGVDEYVIRTHYSFDQEVANEFGISMQAVEQALALLSNPVTVTEYRNSESVEQTSIMLSLSSSYRNSPLDISNIIINTKGGNEIPLSAVLKTETTLRPSKVELEDVTPTSYVTAEVENRSIIYAMIDIMRLLARGDVEGLTMNDWSLFGMTLTHIASGNEVNITWGGEWEMTLENFRDLGIAMMVALALVYGVLVAQYNRFSTPAYILVTVPLGLVGILLGFLLLDTTANVYLTATALIGFIALIGIVVNNAIIFLEYVEQELRAGQSFQEALLGAGQARLRPILLTSLTTVLGSLTIASDPVWSGLAWAIVFGLSLSTILTLVIYPTLLMYFTGKDYKPNT